MRRFELVEGTSSKFWEIAVSGKVLTTRWGRIGAAGSSKQTVLATPAAAAAELIREKTRKGYRELRGSAAAASPAAAATASPAAAAKAGKARGAAAPAPATSRRRTSSRCSTAPACRGSPTSGSPTSTSPTR